MCLLYAAWPPQRESRDPSRRLLFFFRRRRRRRRRRQTHAQGRQRPGAAHLGRPPGGEWVGWRPSGWHKQGNVGRRLYNSRQAILIQPAPAQPFGASRPLGSVTCVRGALEGAQSPPPPPPPPPVLTAAPFHCVRDSHFGAQAQVWAPVALEAQLSPLQGEWRRFLGSKSNLTVPADRQQAGLSSQRRFVCRRRSSLAGAWSAIASASASLGLSLSWGRRKVRHSGRESEWESSKELLHFRANSRARAAGRARGEEARKSGRQ